MKTILAILALVLASCSTVYCQHPNLFLKDIYDLAWCQEMKIKAIQSGGSYFKMMNGVPVGKKSKNVSTQQGGTMIKQTQGRINLKIVHRLSSDLKRLEMAKIGILSTYYFYDEEQRLSYKVNHSNKRKAGTAYLEAFSLEEMTWNGDNQLVEKEIYCYREPLIDLMDDFGELRSKDRKLKARWIYRYNDKGELSTIIIQHFSLIDESGAKIGGSTITIAHKEGLPVTLSVEQSGKATLVMAKKRKFEYHF